MTMVEVMRKKTMVMVVAMAMVVRAYLRKTRSLRWEPLNRIFVACTYRWLEAVAMHLAGSRFG